MNGAVKWIVCKSLTSFYPEKGSDSFNASDGSHIVGQLFVPYKITTTTTSVHMNDEYEVYLITLYYLRIISYGQI